MPEIPDKKTAYDHFLRGGFGNKPQTWNSLEELDGSGYYGEVVLRYKGIGGKDLPQYGIHLSIAEAATVAKQWFSQGARPALLAINEAASDHDLTIQGEVMQTIEHYALFWSDEKTTMREAMKNGRQAYGREALALLKRYLSPSSYEDMQELLDMYPSHVIEFSSYRYNVGGCRGRNTFIWEVRNY